MVLRREQDGESCELSIRRRTGLRGGRGALTTFFRELQDVRFVWICAWHGDTLGLHLTQAKFRLVNPDH